MLKVMFFDNGHTAVFDGNLQMPELQVAWFQLWLKFLIEHGYSAENVQFVMPDGRLAQVDAESLRWSIA
ncbi:MAG: hypothetical protein A2W25_12180 [candidate division Zixibacteria bacterium RBG_16_53_22]|nr:MAG: hypothetical protein A2W25_12180 [candidate division Zixibacteria bacterium RBG_16_53_22]